MRPVCRVLITVVRLAALASGPVSGQQAAPGGWIRDGDGGWISANLVRNPSVEARRSGEPPAWSPAAGRARWARPQRHPGHPATDHDGGTILDPVQLESAQARTATGPPAAPIASIRSTARRALTAIAGSTSTGYCIISSDARMFSSVIVFM